MINQQERHYNILKLNKWFAISSLLFTFVWLLTFANDFNRPWKKYQIEFRNLEIEKTKADIASANTSLDENEEYAELKVAFENAQNEIDSRQEEITALEEKIGTLDADLYAKNQNYQFAKADMDVAKYNFEQAQHGHGDLPSATKALDKLVALTTDTKLQAEVIEGQVEAANEQLKGLRINFR